MNQAELDVDEEDEPNVYNLFNENKDDDDEEGEDEMESKQDGLRIAKSTSELIHDILQLFRQKPMWSMGEILE